MSDRVIVMRAQEKMRCWVNLQTTSAQGVNTVVFKVIIKLMLTMMI